MAPTSLPPAKKRKMGSKAAIPQEYKHFSAEAVAALETTLTNAISAGASLNPLADLLAIATDPNCEPDVTLKAIFASYRLFTLIIKKGLLRSGSDEEAVKLVRAWVNGRFAAFTDILCGLLSDKEHILRTSALKIMFSLLKQLSSCITAANEATSSSRPLQFDVSFFKKIVHALVLCPPSIRVDKGKRTRSGFLYPDIRDNFTENWLNVYTDIRFFLLREFAALLETTDIITTHPSLPENILSMLEKLSGMSAVAITGPSNAGEKSRKDRKKSQFWVEELSTNPKTQRSDEDEETHEDDKEDDWRLYFDDLKETTTSQAKENKGQRRRVYALSVHEQLHDATAHRAVFTRCWLCLIPLLSPSLVVQPKDGDEEQEHLVLVTRALVILHHSILPHLTRPVLIMDWVAGCVDYGGNVGLLAFNALYKLMTEYNLDYPQFYTRLYAFIDRDILHLRHRARFFRLTEVFLSSTHLPATLLASFVKRLSRLTLSAPPAAIIMAIPFTYNILKRHPSLMVMIHRVDASIDGVFNDPYNASEANPNHTGALDSSLWEIVSHRQHYHSTVSTLSRIFEAAFTRPAYTMEDFLDHTYATLFDTEMKRKVKKDPVVSEKELARPMVVRTKADLMEPDKNEQDVQADVVGSMWVFG